MATGFTYSCNQRPLEGYTLKRGIGCGGFGEVYYAISDGGKEVALKLLRQSTDSEKRGIRDCLNFKHPHLVHIYDLRETSDGEVWIIMEYVSGKSLAQLIEEYPHGLPKRLVREWFAAIARAVSYLHDKGVVHRDLKPANIFIEEGHPKIGDYGLARRFSSGELDRMTSGVGTPHYMAPEIRRGTYGRSVDIYACGVILYEMLVGRPPFEGASPVDILMKHQTDPVDLSPIPTPLRPVIAHALEKDPNKRYQSMLEFARAVEEVFDNNQISLDTPMPPALKSPTTKVTATAQTSRDTSRLEATPPRIPEIKSATRDNLPPQPPTVQPQTRTTRHKLRELSSSLTKAGGICLLASLLVGLIFSATLPWTAVAEMFVLSTVISWGILLLGRDPPRTNNEWGRRGLQLLLGVGVGLLGAWLDGWSIPRSPQWGSSRDLVLPNGYRLSPELLGVGLRYCLYFGLTMAAIRWWRLTDRNRKRWFRFRSLIPPTLWAFGFLLLSLGELAGMFIFAAPIVIAAVALQWSAPWVPPAPPPAPIQPLRLRLPQNLVNN
jgi:serine/threonine protein kinase